MEPKTGLKISFCTTCRGDNYLSRLKQTLPQNIENNTQNGAYNNVEFVILAYGDPAVTDWLKTNYADVIKSGLIRSVDLPKEQAEYFKMAHAKNIAHRMATGDVLCNLDSDNITGKNFSGWLNNEFSKNPDILTCVTTRGKFIERITTGKNIRDITGRIAVSKETFEKLHGYAETRNAAVDADDTNFKERAYLSGIKLVALPLSQNGQMLHHSNSERINNMSPNDKQKSEENFSQHADIFSRTQTIKRILMGEENVLPKALAGANSDGNFGCATVTILDENLTPKTLEIKPTIHPQWQEIITPNRSRGIG